MVVNNVEYKESDYIYAGKDKETNEAYLVSCGDMSVNKIAFRLIFELHQMVVEIFGLTFQDAKTDEGKYWYEDMTEKQYYTDYVTGTHGRDCNAVFLTPGSTINDMMFDEEYLFVQAEKDETLPRSTRVYIWYDGYWYDIDCNVPIRAIYRQDEKTIIIQSFILTFRLRLRNGCIVLDDSVTTHPVHYESRCLSRDSVKRVLLFK